MGNVLPLAAAAVLAMGDASPASTPISKAQATSYAQQVNLLAADVPGAEVRPAEPERAKPSRAAVRFARCAGAVNPERRVADIPSPTFSLGAGRSLIEMQSRVEMLPSAALATRNFGAISSARGRACLKRLFPRALKVKSTRGVRLGRVAISFLPNLLAAGQKSFGARIAVTLVNGSRKATLYSDAFAILAGPAEVDLNAVGAFHPVSTAFERRLLSTLYARAVAHSL
jgi:hypothetical protein